MFDDTTKTAMAAEIGREAAAQAHRQAGGLDQAGASAYLYTLAVGRALGFDEDTRHEWAEWAEYEAGQFYRKGRPDPRDRDESRAGLGQHGRHSLDSDCPLFQGGARI